MPNALQRWTPRLASPWRALARLFRRAPPAAVTTHVAGSDFAAGSPTQPGYQVAAAMSAYVAFPWVYACVNAISQDVASRPVKLYRPRKGSDEEIERHPLLDLLNDRPSSRVLAGAFHRQITVDRVLAGNSFRLLLGGRAPSSILRLHPKRVQILPAADGQVEAYLYDGLGIALRYRWEDVVHVRGASWADSPESLFGAGAIEALHQMLTADKASWERQAQSNRQGKPDYIASPDSGNPAAPAMWGPDQVRQIRIALDAILKANHGGVGIAPHDLKLTKLSWTPAELAAGDMREEIRDGVLASFGVPPTRVSLPTANYAQSTDAMRGYWQHTIGGYTSELDETDTQLAREYGRSDRTLFVRRDFSDVPALQEDKNLRLERVRTHWLMGASREAAYAAEGIPAPEGEEREAEPAKDPTAKAKEEADPEGGEAERALVRWLAGTPPKQRAPNAPGDVAAARGVVGESARAARWGRFVADVHGPVEARLHRAMGKFLRDQRERMIRRVANVLEVERHDPDGRHVRAVLSDVELDRILDAATEDRALREALGDELLEAVKRAFGAALADLPAGAVDWTPDRSPVASLIASLIANVNGTTRSAVRDEVLEGLRAGESIADLQARIRAMDEFGTARALTIARTEATRAVSSGTARAYQDAALALPGLKQEWLSARDAAVRDAHADMDGQVVEIGEDFVAPDGQRAPYPGGFSDPALSINCRCSTLPVLDE